MTMKFNHESTRMNTNTERIFTNRAGRATLQGLSLPRERSGIGRSGVRIAGRGRRRGNDCRVFLWLFRRPFLAGLGGENGGEFWGEPAIEEPLENFYFYLFDGENFQAIRRLHA